MLGCKRRPNKAGSLAAALTLSGSAVAALGAGCAGGTHLVRGAIDVRGLRGGTEPHAGGHLIVGTPSDAGGDVVGLLARTIASEGEAPASKQLMSLLAAWGGVLDRDQSKRPPAVGARQ